MVTLTGRQSELMAHLVEGLTNKAIASKMNITVGTVKMMLHMMYEKNGVHNRTALVVRYVEPQGRVNGHA